MGFKHADEGIRHIDQKKPYLAQEMFKSLALEVVLESEMFFFEFGNRNIGQELSFYGKEIRFKES